MTTKSYARGIRKAHAKELVALAKANGFKAYCTPYKNSGYTADHELANFSIDWSTFGGCLADKLKGQKAMQDAMREARLNFFSEEPICPNNLTQYKVQETTL